MKAIFLLLSMTWLIPNPGAWAVGDPNLVETKVQSDLESALARLFPREQFLVSVNAQIGTRAERKLVEGESAQDIIDAPAPVPIPSMPGFAPEPELKKAGSPHRDRQVYRMVDSPYLDKLYVQVAFDEALPALVVSRARQLVENYLRAGYPSQAIISFAYLPMLKPVKEKVEEKKPEPVPPVPPKELEKPTPVDVALWRYARWAIASLLLLMFLHQIFSRNQGPIIAQFKRNKGSEKNSNGLPAPAQGASRNFSVSSAASFRAEESSDSTRSYRRKRLLERFLSHSQAFREYYSKLSENSQAELYSAMKGPAFDSLLENLDLSSPRVEREAGDAEECLSTHQKDFDEFADTKTWEDRQFFGFLHKLSKDQLLSLATRENAAAVCLMLRMMRAEQSAFILDALPSDSRREILSRSSEVKEMSFNDMSQIEKRFRETVQRMPSHSVGARNADVEFWGSVISESRDQETILEEMEKTNPGIYPALKKFKFRLEDAAALPEGILSQVLDDIDNEQLALALATCTEDVAEVLLDAVTPKRRDFLKIQLTSKKGAPKEIAQSARQQVTKRFREALV